ncbi:TPA: class I SAM-dependent methyltransferase [Candidatus Woesearchaeota archaeon]|nr:class I SAM-dependent methyltransferase [Candidatus Woesearchaeota archaeon]
MAQQHYFSETPSSKEIVKKIKANILDHNFEFYTASGVFSAEKIDTGTRILIENITIQENNSVLDFGCGIGVVGIVIKKLFPTTQVYLTDINERAVKISQKNAELNNISLNNSTDGNSMTFFQGNLFEAIPKDIKFDTIISNLPQHAGRKICFEIITRSKDFLNKDGSLQVVARHQKGGKEIEKKMKEVFGNVETLGKESGYRVYLSRNAN